MTPYERIASPIIVLEENVPSIVWSISAMSMSVTREWSTMIIIVIRTKCTSTISHRFRDAYKTDDQNTEKPKS